MLKKSMIFKAFCFQISLSLPCQPQPPRCLPDASQMPSDWDHQDIHHHRVWAYKNREMAGVNHAVVYMQTALKYNTFYVHHPGGASLYFTAVCTYTTKSSTPAISLFSLGPHPVVVYVFGVPIADASQRPQRLSQRLSKVVVCVLALGSVKSFVVYLPNVGPSPRLG